MVDDDGDFGALEAGAAYALYRHGQDRQTQQLVGALRRLLEDFEDLRDELASEPGPELQAIRRAARAPVEVVELDDPDTPRSWDDYIGQDRVKERLKVLVGSAEVRRAHLPHLMLSSPYPRFGKNALIRVAAQSMGVQMIELKPPHSIDAFVEAASLLRDRDILYIDEIQRFCRDVPNGVDALCSALDESTVFLADGDSVYLGLTTIIAATSASEEVPQTVRDRLPLDVKLDRYSITELARIAVMYAFLRRAGDDIDPPLAVDIASASGGLPGMVDMLVTAARDLLLHLGRAPTKWELLEHVELLPDGLNPLHVELMTHLMGYYDFESDTCEYPASDARLVQLLGVSQQAFADIERYLSWRRVVCRDDEGLRLSALGVLRSYELLRQRHAAAGNDAEAERVDAEGREFLRRAF